VTAFLRVCGQCRGCRAQGPKLRTDGGLRGGELYAAVRAKWNERVKS